MTGRCSWCDGPMPKGPNRGSPRRYCSERCRHAFQTAARRYTGALIEDGLLSTRELRSWVLSAKARALYLAPVRARVAPDSAQTVDRAAEALSAEVSEV